MHSYRNNAKPNGNERFPKKESLIFREDANYSGMYEAWLVIFVWRERMNPKDDRITIKRLNFAKHHLTTSWTRDILLGIQLLRTQTAEFLDMFVPDSEMIITLREYEKDFTSVAPEIEELSQQNEPYELFEHFEYFELLDPPWKRDKW